MLVLYGDAPLLSPETLEQMAKVKRERGADLAVLTARTRNIPGRVARDEQGRVSRIIEAQDATPEELEIEERNTGVYLFSADLLRDGLAGNQAGPASGGAQPGSGDELTAAKRPLATHLAHRKDLRFAVRLVVIVAH